jgi:UDP-N-acetylmuramoylalanine--D-glutamate ligase
VVLIAGGKDKGFEFESVKSLVSERCRAVVLIGEMAPRIEAIWADCIPCHRSESLLNAVDRARELSEPGDVVLFSPGTSSFDMFKNYADRGNQFRDIVQSLSS